MIENAKTKHVAVFAVIDSPRNRYVIIVKITIPKTKERKRPGQNSPANPCTAYEVASMKRYVIGIPNNINAQRQSLAHCHSIGPFTCIHTMHCPSVNIAADNAMYLRFIL